MYSPGLGQHYCVECAKHHESDAALQAHWKGKVHKRRCRALKAPAYTQEEADAAAGLGRAAETRSPKADVEAVPTPIAVET